MPSSVIMMELLARGAHADPSGGSNVLELASVLGGEPWSTHPPSVHPALAVVADTVNDLLTDGHRRLLAPLAPWLLGTNNHDARLWPALVKVCDQAVASIGGQNPEPLASPDAAREGLARVSLGRRRGPRAGRRDRRRLDRALWSVQQLSATGSGNQDDADAALCQVLLDCINECRRSAGEPAVDPRLPLEDCPRRVAVRPCLMRSPGCDWMEIGYRPLRDQLPACLRRDPADGRR